MSLIQCPECGKEFSDKAPACPNCGCPTTEIISDTPFPVENMYETINESIDFMYKKHRIFIQGNHMELYKKGDLVAQGQLSDFVLLWNKTVSGFGGGQTEVVFTHPKLKSSLQIVISCKDPNYDDISEFSEICEKYLSKDIQSSPFAAYSYSTTKISNSAYPKTTFSSAPSPTKQGGLSCPNCGSHNIDLWSNEANMKEFQRTGLNLNPLHPLTPFKTKTVKKEKKSAAKIGLGLMTGGTSLLLTGTNKKAHNEYYCRDCGKKWIRK